ncbi:MAG: capsular biosynthesis protein [Helicobacter sp.]|nr:capsular biosynthesis protein [Helicobacter sp.]
MAMLKILKDEYDVSVMGIDSENGSKMPDVVIQDECGISHNIPSFSHPAYKKRNKWQELKLWLNVARGAWDKLSFIPNRLHIITHLLSHHYDVIICHDVLLLPVLFAGLEQSELQKANKENPKRQNMSQSHEGGGIRQKTKVVFDAREFYPLQNTSSLRWRLLFKKFNTYLCATYAPKADVMFSVSPMFCEMYEREFGLKAHLLMSLKPFYNLSPRPIDSQCVKILYHGALNQNRDIDKVIELCRYLDERFCIDFIFTGGEGAFAQKIHSRIHALQMQGKKIRLLSPVALEQIVPFGNAYDIGLLYIPPHNHNLLLTLPNKFFEYIQSRLALLIPPIPSLMPFVKQYDNAIIARDFAITSLAKALSKLDSAQIMRYKEHSNKAAAKLHFSHNIRLVRDRVAKLLA